MSEPLVAEPSRRRKHRVTAVDTVPDWVFALRNHSLALEQMLYTPLRQFLLTLLEVHTEGITFKSLRAFTQISQGNFGYQMSKLEQMGYVTIQKSFKGRYPETRYLITPEGRAALTTYREHLDAFAHLYLSIQELVDVPDLVLP